MKILGPGVVVDFGRRLGSLCHEPVHGEFLLELKVCFMLVEGVSHHDWWNVSSLMFSY